MAIPLTIGAAFYQQVLNGKIPEDMATFDFWARAFIKGGAGGLFAVSVNCAENRFGQRFAETLPGPGAAFIGDSLDLKLRTIRTIIPGGEDEVWPQRGKVCRSLYAGPGLGPCDPHVVSPCLRRPAAVAEGSGWRQEFPVAKARILVVVGARRGDVPQAARVGGGVGYREPSLSQITTFAIDSTASERQ